MALSTNTLTDLIPDIFEAFNVVSREQVGLLTAVTKLTPTSRMPAVGQTLRNPVAPAAVTEDNTAAVIPPETGGQSIANTPLTITKDRAAPFLITGDDQKGLNFGPGHLTIQGQQIAEAIRALTNEAESDLAALFTQFSRANGAAGTTPFATIDDLTDLSETKQILSDNGAPRSDMSLVLGGAAISKFGGKQGMAFKVNEAGTDAFARNGFLNFGFQGVSMRESAQIPAHTKGGGTAYVTSGANAVGTTSIALITGSGTILAGDVVTFAGDTNKYVVTTGIAAPGTIVIGAPGLLVAQTGAEALTIGTSYIANMMFARSAIVIAAGPPALPTRADGSNADQATAVLILTDPMSGLTFEFAEYPLFRAVRHQVSLSWGEMVTKPEHTAILLG